jgi:hypothetical protein
MDGKYSQDYNSVRVEIPLLTSELKYDILMSPHGGSQSSLPSYRKEEVMSNMDSSIKLCAVASLLK